MNNKVTTGAVAVVVIIVGVIVLMAGSNKNAAHDTDSSNSANSTKTSSTSSPNSVTYKGFAVVQKKITVKKGTTVTWTNEDDAMHDVTPDTETADFKASKLFGKGETYKMTFTKAGTYAYHCSPHPYMKGTIEVTE